MSPFLKKDLIVFDLDGTLAESKAPLKKDMEKALIELLQQKKVAVIGGGSYEQFQNQFLSHFNCPPTLLLNLFLFPTTSTSFYRYNKGWKKVYRKVLKASEKNKITDAFTRVLNTVKYVSPKKVYGEVLEDRDSQMSFSPLGQNIVTALGAKKGIALKEKWKKENNPLRLKMAKLLGKELKDFEVRVGGITTIDVTQKGIDKGYGVKQIEKTLHIPISKMVFIGDALYRGGNDAAAKKSGIQTIAVKNPADTIKIIKKILIDSAASKNV
jgi:phosphomannomutase